LGIPINNGKQIKYQNFKYTGLGATGINFDNEFVTMVCEIESYSILVTRCGFVCKTKPQVAINLKFRI
jgi:hypothetical protein